MKEKLFMLLFGTGVPAIDEQLAKAKLEINGSKEVLEDGTLVVALKLLYVIELSRKKRDGVLKLELESRGIAVDMSSFSHTGTDRLALKGLSYGKQKAIFEMYL